jgi:hypothetical protein
MRDIYRTIKLLPLPIKYAVLLYLLLYKTFRPCFKLLCSFFRILLTLRKKAWGSKSDFATRIFLADNSVSLMRDMLIALNSICCGRVLLSGKKTDEITVYINEDVQFDNLCEIFSCFHLTPLTVDFSFYWPNDFHNEKLAFCRDLSEKKEVLANDLQTFINDSYVPVQSIDYFNNCNSNLLDVPVSTKVWARNILKGYPPGFFIICVHLPEFNREDNASILKNWRVFFMETWKNFPSIHFLLLNYSIDWDDELTFDLPNVTITKTLGYGLLEEFALVRLSDMYIGAYDKYATAVIGTNKPFMLISNGGDCKEEACDDLTRNIKQLSRNKNQIWISKIHSPEEIYLMFKEFYADIYGK